MNTRTAVMLAIALILEGCCSSSTLASSVRSWSAKNLPQYRDLVDARFSDPDTRANARKSMAALVCSADTADNKKDTAACKCQQATDDAEAQCKAFFESL